MTTGKTRTVPRALVLRAPGINCDRETAHACRLAGFETELVHINRLIEEPARLLDYHLLVIPGGFSYGDDLGAGTLLAKNLTIHLGEQLQRFIDGGRLVLGICNGFQALVRAGLLPDAGTFTEGLVAVGTRFIASGAQSDGPSSLAQGGEGRDESRPYDGPGATLTNNASARFECRWVTLAVQDGPCIFTRGIDHPIELPVAHGEGQFALADPALLSDLRASRQIPIVYTIGAWQASRKSPSPATPPFSPYSAGVPYPDNPNGSAGNVAGICNERGNVFGLMPHPERYVQALQHPQRRADGMGDGLLIFKNAYAYVQGILRQDAYASSGVDIAVAEATKAWMRAAVQAAQGPEVLAGMDAFAGVFDLGGMKEMRRPALVASTDGVGTKTLIAGQARRFDRIGYDLVNHSVNDLLTQGARPLFFMDYLAMGQLDAEQAAAIVRSVANACREAGCALLGGETAEMPDVYLPGAFDLAGTIVGILDWDAKACLAAMQPGDVLLGLPSSGLHTNGYSLARRVFARYALETVFPELGEPLVDALLRPHRGYLREMSMLREHLEGGVKGAAHITGGGFEGNVSRILPEGVLAVIDTNAWDVPPLFGLIQRLGNISRNEMYRTFNMGIGMVLVFSPEAAQEARHLVPELRPVGWLREGAGVVLNPL